MFPFVCRPRVHGGGGPDLDEDLAVGRSRRLGLMLGRKVIRNGDVTGHDGAALVCAHHCDDGERHTQIIAYKGHARQFSKESTCLLKATETRFETHPGSFAGRCISLSS